MNITPPHFGNFRFHSNDVDLANRNASTAPAATSNATADVAPTTIAPVEAAAVVQKPAFDSEAVAKTILSFVQQRLAKDAENGASKDQLAALLAQAREGVTAGFGQAVGQLKDSGELTDAVSSGISSALQKVDSGFSDLAKQLGLTAAAAAGTTAAPAPKNTSAPTTTVETSTNTPVPQSGSLSQLAAAYKTSFSSKQSVDLVVKTADGDTVHLQLGVKQKQSISASYQSNADGQQLSISSREKSSGQLNISVDGNLDAGELKALGDLLNQVGDLADSFFSGDIGSAFQQAGALDLSSPELSSLSLDLRSEVTTKSKIAAYSAVQSLADAPALSDTSSATDNTASNTPSTTSSPLRLTDLADALTALVPKATLAENPANLLKHMLAAQIGAADQQNNPLLDFVNRILSALGADAPSEATASTPAATTAPAATSNLNSTFSNTAT